MSRSERTWDLERQDKARGCCTTSVPSCAAFRPLGGCFPPLHSLPALPRYLTDCWDGFVCHVEALRP